jgi:hypothetical protein
MNLLNQFYFLLTDDAAPSVSGGSAKILKVDYPK